MWIDILEDFVRLLEQSFVEVVKLFRLVAMSGQKISKTNNQSLTAPTVESKTKFNILFQVTSLWVLQTLDEQSLSTAIVYD